MSETPDDLAATLDEIREREKAATHGPWEAEDSENCWKLFGAVAYSENCWKLFGAVASGMHPLQLIKAPKHGTPYAEYWPAEADAAFIVAARSDVPRLLAALDEVLKLHQPVTRPSFKPKCAVCTDERGAMALWPCPEYEAITQALLMPIRAVG